MSQAPEEQLLAVWNAASSHPFQPLVAKDLQFTTAFLLLLAGIHHRLVPLADADVR
jgi:hypothetical protein